MAKPADTGPLHHAAFRASPEIFCRVVHGDLRAPVRCNTTTSHDMSSVLLNALPQAPVRLAALRLPLTTSTAPAPAQADTGSVDRVGQSFSLRRPHPGPLAQGLEQRAHLFSFRAHTLFHIRSPTESQVACT